MKRELQSVAGAGLRVAAFAMRHTHALLFALLILAIGAWGFIFWQYGYLVVFQREEAVARPLTIKEGELKTLLERDRVREEFKKTIAEKIVYGALLEAQKKLKSSQKDEKEEVTHDGAEGVIAIFQKTLEAISPTVEVRSRRVGGSTYQIPVEVRPSRRSALAMRWLVDAAKGRSEKTMALISREMVDAMADVVMP